MKPVIKIFLFSVLAIFLFLIVYLYNKPGRDVEKETAISISAVQLFKTYAENEVNANKIYLDKAIDVHGTVSDFNKNQQGQTVIILQTDDPMFGVACTLKSNNSPPLTKGSKIKLKGICSGFTNDVVLRDCIISND